MQLIYRVLLAVPLDWYLPDLTEVKRSILTVPAVPASMGPAELGHLLLVARAN